MCYIDVNKSITNKNAAKLKIFVVCDVLTHSHTMTPFDAPGEQAF